jgi:REP element-mobilizing transposase RayT
VVNEHIHSFGTISDNKIKLSVNGNIAMERWIWLGRQFPYLGLISFVVMPDHIHGIIFINSDYYTKRPGVEILKIKPLPELIGAYKTTVSKQIHAQGDVDFKWQNSYHDHIIRNDWELIRIKRYIDNNPANWLCKEGSRPFLT